jgi:hypothetical protein
MARKSRHSDVKISVLAMGKHPAWPDFVEDSPVQAAAVTAARDVLWTRGLQRAAQLGAFEQVAEAGRVAFAHDCLVATGAGVCVARVWNSGDGKGKTGWPMIAMAHAEPVDASWLCEVAPARLYAVQEMVTQTRSRQLVGLSLGEAARQIEDTLALVVGSPRASVSDGALLAQADASKVAAAMELLSEKLVPDEKGDVGACVRLPRLVNDARALENARLWLVALREQVDPAVPIVLMERDKDSFVDVIVGYGRSERWAAVRDATVKDSLAGREAPTSATMARVKQLQTTLGKRTRGAQPAAREPHRLSRRSVALLAIGGAMVVVTAIGIVLTRGSGFGEEASPSGVFAKARDGARAGGAGVNVRDERAVSGDVITAAALRDAMSAVEREASEQGVSLPDGLAARAAAVIDAGAQPQDEAREVARFVAATQSELAGNVLAVIREREPDVADLDEAQRAVADAWRTRLTKINPRDGLVRVRERLDREQDGYEIAMGVLAKTKPSTREAGASESALLARAIENARRERATGLAVLVRDGAERASIEAAAGELENVVKALTGDGGELGPVDSVPALQASARAGLARGDSWEQLAPTHAALAAAAERLNVRAAAGEEIRRLEAVREVTQVPTEKLLEAMRAASADTTGKRVAEIMQAWRRMTGEGVPAETLADAYASMVKPAIAQVPAAGARAALEQEASRRARDAWIAAAGDAKDVASDDASVMEREKLAKQLDAQPPQRAGDNVPVWQRAQARLEAARLRRAISEGASDDALMEQAKKFVERVDAAGDALETWADAKQLRALAALSRDAIAQQAGTREWIGTAGPAKAGWKVAAGITAESVRFVSPAGESVEFVRHVKGDGADDESKREAAVYIARSEVSVGEVMAVLRDQAAAAVILPMLWQFDPAADPRVGPRAWSWANAKRAEIVVPRAWHAPLASGEVPAIAPGLVGDGPGPKSPMNYVSAKAAEAIAEAMHCRLLTEAEWRDAAAASAGALSNLPDETWRVQDAFAQRVGMRAANPRGDTNWSNSQAAETSDGVLWFWAVDRGLEAAKFANVRGNVAEWVRGGDGSGGPVIIGGSAMTMSGDGAVAATSGDALRGFADVGLRVAFDVAKDVATNDAIATLRERGGAR